MFFSAHQDGRRTKKKKKQTRAAAAEFQTKCESRPIRAISLNTEWLGTHLSNRGGSFSGLLPASLSLSHTHKRAVLRMWVNVFIPQSFKQMLISWNSYPVPILREKAQRFSCRRACGQRGVLLTHILQPHTKAATFPRLHVQPSGKIIKSNMQLKQEPF